MSPKFYHYRSELGTEVDIVLEKGLHLISGVEIKATQTPVAKDFKGLKDFRDALGQQFHRGVLLYTDTRVVSFGDRLYAVPLQALWT